MTLFSLTAGPVFWLLLALAIAAVIVYFERVLELRRAQIDWQDFINGATNILDKGNVEEALAICEDTESPIANLLSAAITHRDSSMTALKEVVDSQKRADISRLARRTSLLSLIGDVAPLLGLLGTILGFIKAVMLCEAQEMVTRVDFVNATMEALISAAMGLAVWIPVMVLSFSLRNRMNRMVNNLDAASSRIINYFGAKK